MHECIVLIYKVVYVALCMTPSNAVLHLDLDVLHVQRSINGVLYFGFAKEPQ